MCTQRGSGLFLWVYQKSRHCWIVFNGNSQLGIRLRSLPFSRDRGFDHWQDWGDLTSSFFEKLSSCEDVKDSKHAVIWIDRKQIDWTFLITVTLPNERFMDPLHRVINFWRLTASDASFFIKLHVFIYVLWCFLLHLTRLGLKKPWTLGSLLEGCN